MLLSPTQLVRIYTDWCHSEGRHRHTCLGYFCHRLTHNKCPVQGATRELYRLLATAICKHSEPLLDQMLRMSIAASLKFPPSSVARRLAASNEEFSYLSSEMATINALDLPCTLRHFPAGEGGDSLQQHFRCSKGGSQCERLLETRMREVYFPRRSAKLLVNWKLKEFLGAAIDEVAARLFVKLFSTTSEDTIEDSASEILSAPCLAKLTKQKQSETAAVAAAAAAVAAAAALNTDGSNSYRQQYNEEQPLRQAHQHLQQSLETSSTTASQQHLCRMHASGARQPAGESSCAVCAARHFFQQHLVRISRDPENLAKLERTLRDCLELQKHWDKSLQWIAANVKDHRLPEFVRPLVKTCGSHDDCGRSETVNPQIIITTEAQLNNQSTWDKKSPR